MAESVFAGIQSLTDLEEGIRTFGYQMASASNQIESTIDLYFENFERGLQILEERLRKAEEELEAAERALERQRNKRVWVIDEDGDGHWEQADCSAEEARVARCMAVRDRCLSDVNMCKQMIADARTRRYIHKEKFTQFQSSTSEAVDKIGPAKELVAKHCSMDVPSSTISCPRPSMNTKSSFSSKSAPAMERPRSPQNERVNPLQSHPITETDRPRSPFGDVGRVGKNDASSFWEAIRKIKEENQNKESNE